MNNFQWVKGRQQTGYEKMLLLQGTWPLLFDSYLIRYHPGEGIPTHTDPVSDKRHYRLNIVLKNAKKGGNFVCENAFINTARIKFFRPDVSPHSVVAVEEGTRYILSIGWALKK